MLGQSAFVDLCERELRLCALRPGERMVVLSQGAERQEYVEAFLAAGARLGATTLHARLPDASPALDGDVGVWTVGATPLATNPLAVDVLKSADLVIDVVFLLHSKELVEIQKTGTRLLTCIEPVDILARLFPTEELAARVRRAVALLASARTLRIKSALGTDVTYEIGSYPTIGQYGYCDKPGQWDHWSSTGMVYTYGADDGVSGTIVVAPGDILLPFKQYVQTPITFEIEGGTIRNIIGGLDAELVKQYMTAFNDLNAYGLSHVGWGMNENAQWSSLATDRRGHGMELRAWSGNVLFATGPNTQVGGPNNTHCHLDIPMRNCTLELDARPVIVDGQVIVDDLQPSALVETTAG